MPQMGMLWAESTYSLRESRVSAPVNVWGRAGARKATEEQGVERLQNDSMSTFYLLGTLLGGRNSSEKTK
jgi:hypothetical protein